MVTVSKQTEQLGLFGETAANPQGTTPASATSPLEVKRSGVPKSPTGKNEALPPMTMEEIADETNLRRAFAKVAANRGAPGPDRQTIDEAKKRLSDWLPKLHRSLLEGLTNKYFERAGLITLREHWRSQHNRIWRIGPTQLLLQVG